MKVYKVIGLMSGTSLDGLDIVYTHFWKKNSKWSFDIKHCNTIAYTSKMKSDLSQSISIDAKDLLALDIFYGKWLGYQVKNFIQKNNIKVDFIASHGHTTHHRPEKGFSYQIGSGQVLAHESNCKVICDFRSNDISLGGQGAPLVPIGDKYLFSEHDFFLNLGGICNISCENNGLLIAYDVGICNMLLNYLTLKVNKNYDNRGLLASKGKVITALYDSLNNLAFYNKPYPKSIGYEWFINEIVPLINKYNEKIENLLCTSVHHICEEIAKSLNNKTQNAKKKLLVTGGGAFNDFFISILKNKLNKNIELDIPPKQIVEYKEALIFAFMGVLKEEGEINVLASVTGACKDSICGVSYFPV